MENYTDIQKALFACHSHDPITGKIIYHEKKLHDKFKALLEEYKADGFSSPERQTVLQEMVDFFGHTL